MHLYLQQIHTLVILAWRNLWRNHKRTGIMLSAIAIGVWAMIFMTALLRGMVEDMLERGVNNLPGHVQIHHHDYLSDPSIANALAEPSGPLLTALNSHGLWYSRIKVPAMIASERETRAVQLTAIDPQKERTHILSGLTITHGEFLKDGDAKGIVIGAKLAERLETRLGKRIVLMSQDQDNNLVEKGMRITGIYSAQLANQEEQFIFAGKKTIDKMLNLNQHITEIAIFGADYRTPNIVLEQLKPHLTGDASIASWQTINAYLSSIVRSMDGFVWIWIIVVFLALSFGLANTLVMAVFERIREIGLMLALGMRPKMILWQVMFESAFLLVIGLTLGNTLAIICIKWAENGIDLSSVSQGLEMIGAGSTMYPALLPNDLIAANSVVMILGLLTALLPAWQASRHDPIKALNTH